MTPENEITETNEDEVEKSADHRFPVVALGASAGGLQPLEDFFSNAPPDSGMAFVVVTHQHAGQASLLRELLARETTMPVVELSENHVVLPDHVYTVRPGYNVTLVDGLLRPQRAAGPAPSMPVDGFLRSLARERKDRAVAIILSGNGSDGTLGIKEIKGELGMVMVQDERTAEYSSMPRNAIATGMADYVVSPTEMPQTLLGYFANRFEAAPRPPAPPDAMERLFSLIRKSTGHDFSQYKKSTVNRRIERRMNVHHISSLDEYVDHLDSNPDEVELLFRELLIGVTSFFRDPDAWEALAPALCDLMAVKPSGYVFRAWVPGCSTGEEAYTLAIIMRECMDKQQRNLSCQIFATDLDVEAVGTARIGSYPSGIASDVSSQRLLRFFNRHEDSYRVKKDIREMLVFAEQNFIADPPFSKLDLISCRNLLIYLNSTLQQRLMPVLHYALKPGGLLFLGASESLGAASELFDVIDKKWKVFRRKEVSGAPYITELPSAPRIGGHAMARPPRREVTPPPGLEQIASRLLLDELVPPTVVLDERGDAVFVHGRTGLYLEPAPGAQPSANVFQMARRGLQINLPAAVRQAASSNTEVIHRGVEVKSNGETTKVDLRVARIDHPGPLRGLFRATFTPVPGDREGERGAREGQMGSVAALERELQRSRESHQATIEELETANEELQSTNEELQSTNEELQSANEELETSKEEMQSLNEELQTVNAELQNKVEELTRTSNDLKNLLNSTDIATVFLDAELCIKRYTEQAKDVIPLIPSDLGRPIGDLVSSLHYDSLVPDAEDVLRKLIPREAEIRAKSGTAYLMRILPYRTSANVIEGLVLTFVDISPVKRIQRENDRLLDALRRSPVGVYRQDADFRFLWASSQVFGHEPEWLVGKTDAAVFGKDDADTLRRIKEQVVSSGKAGRVRLELGVGGEERRQYDLYIRRDLEDGEVRGVSVVATDLTKPDVVAK